MTSFLFYTIALISVIILFTSKGFKMLCTLSAILSAFFLFFYLIGSYILATSYTTYSF